MQGIAIEEFFIERFVGRYDRGIHGPARYAWLIKWEGYVLIISRGENAQVIK